MDITLLIPVRNRHYNLPRVIKYFEDLECRKIILDSSNQRYKEQLSSSYEYEYFGSILFYKKMYEGISKVKTKYCLICADDDFIIKKSIKECYDFLINNNDYVWADGMLSDYHNKKFMVNVTKPNLKVLKNYSERIKGQYKSDDIIDRIKHDLNPFFIEPLYGLVKTEAIKKGYEVILDNPILHPVKYYAKIISVIVSCYGNHRTLENLFLIKSCFDALLTQQKSILEKELQPHLPIETIATKEKCSILAKYIYEITKQYDVDYLTNFLIYWFNNYKKDNVFSNENKQEPNSPLYDPKYDKEKEFINSL